MNFPNAFWHGKEAFPKFSSQNEIVPLLVIFHLPYSKYWGVKIFLLVSLSKSKFFTQLALVLFVQHSCRQCRNHVAFVLLVSGTRVVNQTRFSLRFSLAQSFTKNKHIQKYLPKILIIQTEQPLLQNTLHWLLSVKRIYSFFQILQKVRIFQITID